MPELPEVERARQVVERALGRVVTAVDDADGFVCRPHRPGEIASALVGRALTAAHRRGIATGVVNAGGSFGQFLMAPIAAALMISVGWVSAL